MGLAQAKRKQNTRGCSELVWAHTWKTGANQLDDFVDLRLVRDRERKSSFFVMIIIIMIIIIEHIVNIDHFEPV